jgi:hypothetical protein
MAITRSSRARLPEIQRSLRPPDEHQLESERILEAGRIERRERAMAARRRAQGIDDDGIKLIG